MFALWKWWHYEADRRLRAQIEAIRARGEPVEFSQAWPTMEFDHRSAGVDVAAAARLFGEFTRGRGIESGGTKLLQPPQPSAEAAARVTDVFATAKRAATKPVGPLPSPTLTGLKELATMLRPAAVRQHQLRRDAEAVALIAALLQQADVTFVSYPSLSFHQSGVETRSGAASAVIYVTPTLRIEPARSESSVTSADVRDLIRRLLDDSHMAASFTRAWQTERVRRMLWSHWRPSSHAPNVVYRHDMVRAIRQTTQLVEASRGGTFPRQAMRDVTPPPPPQSALDRWARATSSYLEREWSPALLTHYNALADERAAAVHLAIKLYSLDHDGEPPATLEALVPAYLPAVPRDPFADGGRAMSYRVGGRLAVVYSVGPNGVDDAAAATAAQGLSDIERDYRRRSVVRQVIHDDLVYPIILPGDDN